MKKSIVVAALAVVVVVGARWHYSPVEKQAFYDPPKEDPKAPKIDLRKLGRDPANAVPVAPTPYAGKPGQAVEWVSIVGGKV